MLDLTAYNGQLDAAALASVIPAVRQCLAALSQKLSCQFRVQAMLQLTELVAHAAMLMPSSCMVHGLQQLATSDAFKATWAAEDVAALLKVCQRGFQQRAQRQVMHGCCMSRQSGSTGRRY